ncbi:hypothetical protein HZA97_03665 [Candidatus Woesearchaeota archaeon]|nr:hypothetical protein [Candidatus Woesearchaeota archaeon]
MKRWWLNKKVQRVAKIVLYTVLAAEVAVVSSFGYQLRGNKSIQPYIEKNLTQLIQNQEKVLGIKHFGVPKVEYGLPKDIPNIVKIAGVFRGFYTPENDTIYLVTGTLVTPEHTWEDILGNIFNLGETKVVNDTLYHELGHYYADKLGEMIGIPEDASLSQSEIISTKLVSEGIAEYFEHKTLGTQYDKPPEYLDELEKFTSDTAFFYDGGYQLVKPIIDKYGDKGIAYLMIMLPTTQELIHLSEYQKKAMKFLEEH